MDEATIKETSILYLGDVHMIQIKDIITSRNNLFGNEYCTGIDYLLPEKTFAPQRTITVNLLRKTYENFKKTKKIVPNIVVFQGGSYDVARTSTINVVVSSILRLIKSMKTDGVLSIVICALIPRDIPPPFNEKILQINRILFGKIKDMKNVYFTKCPQHLPLKPENYQQNNILLKKEIYSHFLDILKPIMKKIQLSQAYENLDIIKIKMEELGSLLKAMTRSTNLTRNDVRTLNNLLKETLKVTKLMDNKSKSVDLFTNDNDNKLLLSLLEQEAEMRSYINNTVFSLKVCSGTIQTIVSQYAL